MHEGADGSAPVVAGCKGLYELERSAPPRIACTGGASSGEVGGG
jgi:hypothetical protein